MRSSWRAVTFKPDDIVRMLDDSPSVKDPCFLRVGQLPDLSHGVVNFDVRCGRFRYSDIRQLMKQKLQFL